MIHDNKESKLPQLVYMSRERRPSSPHRFKAGALNALVSNIILHEVSHVHIIFDY